MFSEADSVSSQSLWSGFGAVGNTFQQGAGFLEEIQQVVDHYANTGFVHYFNTTGILQHNDIGPQVSTCTGKGFRCQQYSSTTRPILAISRLPVTLCSMQNYNLGMYLARLVLRFKATRCTGMTSKRIKRSNPGRADFENSACNAFRRCRLRAQVRMTC